jgi:4-oxalocrotonate tautomerase
VLSLTLSSDGPLTDQIVTGIKRQIDDRLLRPGTRLPSIRGLEMPLIQVRVIKDVFNKDQKRQIINKLTDAMVSVEGENMRGVTWVTIEEVDSGDWGIGGKALTTSDVHALAAGKAA